MTALQAASAASRRGAGQKTMVSVTMEPVLGTKLTRGTQTTLPHVAPGDAERDMPRVSPWDTAMSVDEESVRVTCIVVSVVLGAIVYVRRCPSWNLTDSVMLLGVVSVWRSPVSTWMSTCIFPAAGDWKWFVPQTTKSSAEWCLLPGLP